MTPAALEAQRRRRRALADAVAGVVSAVVSLWTFYPIEVWKTNLQAGSSSVSKKSLFQGCREKTLHTASSSFCYFFLYSWIFSNWRRRAPNAKVHPATRLMLSAVAAMLNTLITLPLDVVSSRIVTRQEHRQNMERKKMDRIWENVNETEESSSEESSAFEDCLPVASEENKGGKLVTTSTDENKDERTIEIDDSKDDEEGWLSLWKGLTPALLLCSNPAINYTVFEMTRNRILSRTRMDTSHLSMPEAFLVGLFAKFIATISTYPLIRAKVILMVTAEKSLLASLIRSYRKEGVRGLYKGCDWQLIHTVLKSALMMMVREKITFSTQQLIVGTAAADASQ